MTKAFSYLRTSGDDGKEKAGLPVQREGCATLAAQKGFEIVREFADDDSTLSNATARTSDLSVGSTQQRTGLATDAHL